MPGRNYSSTNYRYGFNGKENDNDVKGSGNQQDYGMRIYDPRLGKFLSVDPLEPEFPWNSTYAFAENDVIRSIDLDGAEKKIATFSSKKVIDAGLQQATSEDLKKMQNTFTLTLDRNRLKSLLIKSSSKAIENEYYFSRAQSSLVNYGSVGKIPMSQNPITKVVKIEKYTTPEIITENGQTILKTTSITKTTMANIEGPAFKNTLKEVTITTVTTVTLQQLKFDGSSIFLTVAGEGVKNSVNSSIKTINLDKDYVKDLQKLPEDLKNAVIKANDDNWGIARDALKGINDATKKMEEDATDGKLIPKKGKHFPGKNKPPSGNF